jgi:hypothetical protein
MDRPRSDRGSDARRATGENDSDEIFTQAFQLSKGCPLLSVVLVGIIS